MAMPPVDAPQTLPVPRGTTIVESVGMGAGVLLIGLSYLAGVMTTAGLTVVIGTVLMLSAVTTVVAAWMIDRMERRLVVVVHILDRHERDRVQEYGALMRKLDASQRSTDAILGMIGKSLGTLADIQERTLCTANQNSEETRRCLDAMSEVFASELLAVNGAMGGLRSIVGDVMLARSADEADEA